MAIYSGDFTTTVTTTANPAMDFKSPSTNSARIMEMAIMLNAATASTYAILRSNNTPTQSSTSTLIAENPADPAGQTTQAVTWTTAPTSPGVYYRRVYLPATQGSGIVFTYPRGLVIAANAASIVVWNLGTNSASTFVRCVVDE